MGEVVFQARRSDVFAAADVVQRSMLSWLKKRLVLAETLAVRHVLVRNLISPLRRACMLPQAFLSFVSPKERNQRKGDPGIARKPERKFACQGAGKTRVPLPSARSNICRLKTLANDFLPARFTGFLKKEPNTSACFTVF